MPGAEGSHGNMCRGTRPDAGRRGAALFMVLVFAALLSGLAGVALRSGMSGARAAAVFTQIMQADELGRSAGDLVIAYLDPTHPERRRDGSFAVHMPGAEIDVVYLSESARVDVNAAPPELIDALLTVAGADPGEMKAIDGRIAALRRQDKAAGAVAGDDTAMPIGRDAAVTPVTPLPAAATQPAALPVPAIQSTADVARAWGLGPDLARRLLPGLTVASRSSKVDPVLAEGLVLSALFGGDADRVSDYKARRGTGFASRESALLLLPPEAKLFAGLEDAAPLRARARVTLPGGFVRRYEVVVRPAETAGGAAKILSWQRLS